MPRDVSPASYSPGVSLKRGPFTSDPVIPGGSVAAGCGAKGLPSSASGFFAGSGADPWAGACALGGCAEVWARSGLTLTPEHKTIAATARRNVTLGNRFIISPLGFFLEHCLHNFDLGSLRIIRIGRKVEQVGILSGTRGVKQILHHDQGTIVVLNHSD